MTALIRLVHQHIAGEFIARLAVKNAEISHCFLCTCLWHFQCILAVF